MEALRDRALGKIVELRQGETTVAMLMFAYSFLAMTSHNILKPVTQSKFIDQLGADNQPWVQLAVGVLISVLMHGYSHAARRLPRGQVIPAAQMVIVALLLFFWVMLRTDAVWVPVALYALGLLLGVFLISQFWTLANDIYDARQAKRLFGFIGGGASLGGVLGGLMTRSLVYQVGSAGLLLISAAFLAACVFIVRAIITRQPALHYDEEFSEEQGVGGREALRLLARSHHLKVMALAIGCAAAGAAIVQQQLSMAAEATGGDVDRITAYFAVVTVYTSIAGFVVQMALTSRIHRSMGLAFAMLLLPVALGSTATVVLISGALWAPQLARVLDTTLRYTVDKTTREVLFLPLSPELKNRAKPFIDVTAERFAKAMAAILILVLINKQWGLGLEWRQLSYASLAMTGLWIAMALVGWREYRRAFRASIGSREIAPGTIRAELADAATIETLVEELSHPDEKAVLYAIEMLEALDKHHLVTPLLLQHESPRVRARTLRALALSKSRVAGRWMPTVARMVQDEDVDVRAAALRALAELEHEDAAVLMRRHLSDVEPRVVVTSAITLANSGRADDVAAAEAALRLLIADARDSAAAGRAEAATALAHIDDGRFRPLLVPLLYDRESIVVQKAIRSARDMGASDGLFVPGLLSLLGHRALKAPARDALIGYGEDVVDALAHALSDHREQVWIRRHIPATLALLGTQRSMDALVVALDDPDGFLRYKAIAAIEKIRREHGASITCPRPVLESQVVKETSRYYNALTLQQNLARHAADSRRSLLSRALEDKLHRTIDRIYRLLGLLYHVDDVAAARYTIEQGESRTRAAAVEYLDNLLGGVVRKRVMPILDDTPMADKVRLANVVLKSRPRDLEDTLAQLIHEDDPVIAAAAIHFVGQRRLWNLADDLEYVTVHRPRQDGGVIEAASWALSMKRLSNTHTTMTLDTLPIVELTDRIRVVPLFASLSVDELFRIVEAGQEVRYPAGRVLCQSGEPAEEVLFLLEGSARRDSAATDGDVVAPAVLGFEEVLQGIPFRHTVHAVEHCVCFHIAASDFMTMVSDNVLLAQSLFGILLQGKRRVPFTATTVFPSERQASAAADAARHLRQDPLLSKATAAQLLALTAIAPEIPLKAGRILFDVGTPPAVYQIVQGEVLLEMDGANPIVAMAGVTVGVADTLAGMTSGWRATVTRDGRALRLDREELFAVLADHVDLMQGLFSGVIALREPGMSAVETLA